MDGKFSIILEALGISRQNRKWIIAMHGYANVIPSPGDVVYGLLFEVNPEDEILLDRCEGVPDYYSKQFHSIEVLTEESGGFERKEVTDILVYVDVARTESSLDIALEYIPRMNKAIVDGRLGGIPEDYIKAVLRHYIPEQ